jgi:streptomycin 6-kinase
LLERCRPGTYVHVGAAGAALRIIAELLPRLWKPAGPPFRSLAEETEWWTIRDEWDKLGKPFDESLVDAAEAAFEELVPSQGEQVLLHQDLHAGNVLAAEREPWLVIDPKPLVGEREFGLAPIIRSFELGHSRKEVLRRLDFLSAELGLDRERARGWAIGQTIAWSFDSVIHEHAEVARWLLEAAA